MGGVPVVPNVFYAANWILLVGGIAWQARRVRWKWFGGGPLDVRQTTSDSAYDFAEREAIFNGQFQRFKLRSGLVAGLFTLAAFTMGAIGRNTLPDLAGRLFLFVCMGTGGFGLMLFFAFALTAVGRSTSWSEGRGLAPLITGFAEYVTALIDDLRSDW